MKQRTEAHNFSMQDTMRTKVNKISTEEYTEEKKKYSAFLSFIHKYRNIWVKQEYSILSPEISNYNRSKKKKTRIYPMLNYSIRKWNG